MLLYAGAFNTCFKHSNLLKVNEMKLIKVVVSKSKLLLTDLLSSQLREEIRPHLVKIVITVCRILYN